MSLLGSLITAALYAVAASPGDDTVGLKRFTFNQVEMAAEIRIILYALDEETANQASDAAYHRFRELNLILSDYDPQSEVRRLCETSTTGKPVRVSDDLWRVLARAQEISNRSQGAFDVTVGPVVRLWRRARRQEKLPSPERLDEARRKVGYQYVKLHPEDRSVELLRDGMRIDLGGIAMGYSVDEAMKVIRRHGVTRFLVDGSGDIGAGDPPPGSPGWVVGVPGLDADARPAVFVRLANQALTTSGDAVQSVEIGGLRYSHIVDPRTGMAIVGRSSASVAARDTMTADALASAVSVLGPEMGCQLIEATPGAAAFIVRLHGDKTHVYESRRWAELPKVAGGSVGR